MAAAMARASATTREDPAPQDQDDQERQVRGRDGDPGPPGGLRDRELVDALHEQVEREQEVQDADEHDRRQRPIDVHRGDEERQGGREPRSRSADREERAEVRGRRAVVLGRHRPGLGGFGIAGRHRVGRRSGLGHRSRRHGLGRGGQGHRRCRLGLGQGRRRLGNGRRRLDRALGRRRLGRHRSLGRGRVDRSGRRARPGPPRPARWPDALSFCLAFARPLCTRAPASMAIVGVSPSQRRRAAPG